MVNSEIRFFAARDGAKFYTVSKNKQTKKKQMTVVQIMNSLFPNTDLKLRREGKPLGHSDMT